MCIPDFISIPCFSAEPCRWTSSGKLQKQHPIPVRQGCERTCRPQAQPTTSLDMLVCVPCHTSNPCRWMNTSSSQRPACPKPVRSFKTRNDSVASSPWQQQRRDSSASFPPRRPVRQSEEEEGNVLDSPTQDARPKLPRRNWTFSAEEGSNLLKKSGSVLSFDQGLPESVYVAAVSA